MILYFTGTGNSKYVAERLSEKLGDEILCINGKIKSHDYSPITTGEKVVIVTPTYAWRIPTVVDDWVRKTAFDGAKYAWFVMDCGGEIGDADKYNRTLSEGKGLIHMGTQEVIMPENYIAMFDVPNEAESRSIISNADSRIDETATLIQRGSEVPKVKVNAYGKIMSSAVNPAFYKLFVKARAFHADSKCVGCGKCVELCPLGNITLTNGKPVWGDKCTHCMACICYCPTEAIEYGKKSVGKRRYRCE